MIKKNRLCVLIQAVITRNVLSYAIHDEYPTFFKNITKIRQAPMQYQCAPMNIHVHSCQNAHRQRF